MLPEDIESAGIALTAADFDSALSEARASYSDSIGAPKVSAIQTEKNIANFNSNHWFTDS